MVYSFGCRVDNDSNAVTVIDEENETASTTGYVNGEYVEFSGGGGSSDFSTATVTIKTAVREVPFFYISTDNNKNFEDLETEEAVSFSDLFGLSGILATTTPSQIEVVTYKGKTIIYSFDIDDPVIISSIEGGQLVANVMDVQINGFACIAEVSDGTVITLSYLE